MTNTNLIVTVSCTIGLIDSKADPSEICMAKTYLCRKVGLWSLALESSEGQWPSGAGVFRPGCADCCCVGCDCGHSSQSPPRPWASSSAAPGQRVRPPPLLRHNSESGVRLFSCTSLNDAASPILDVGWGLTQSHKSSIEKHRTCSGDSVHADQAAYRWLTGLFV